MDLQKPEKDFVYRKFEAREKDNFEFVELNSFWNVEADFDKDFYYCLCIRCYQDAIDFDKETIKETIIEEISSDESEELDESATKTNTLKRSLMQDTNVKAVTKETSKQFNQKKQKISIPLKTLIENNSGSQPTIIYQMSQPTPSPMYNSCQHGYYNSCKQISSQFNHQDTLKNLQFNSIKDFLTQL
ncbi:10366_t:CDS:2, partial [Funneliformis mosseae]